MTSNQTAKSNKNKKGSRKPKNLKQKKNNNKKNQKLIGAGGAGVRKVITRQVARKQGARRNVLARAYTENGLCWAISALHPCSEGATTACHFPDDGHLPTHASRMQKTSTLFYPNDKCDAQPGPNLDACGWNLMIITTPFEAYPIFFYICKGDEEPVQFDDYLKNWSFYDYDKELANGQPLKARTWYYSSFPNFCNTAAWQPKDGAYPTEDPNDVRKKYTKIRVIGKGTTSYLNAAKWRDGGRVINAQVPCSARLLDATHASAYSIDVAAIAAMVAKALCVDVGGTENVRALTNHTHEIVNALKNHNHTVPLSGLEAALKHTHPVSGESKLTGTPSFENNLGTASLPDNVADDQVRVNVRTLKPALAHHHELPKINTLMIPAHTHSVEAAPGETGPAGDFDITPQYERNITDPQDYTASSETATLLQGGSQSGVAGMYLTNLRVPSDGIVAGEPKWAQGGVVVTDAANVTEVDTSLPKWIDEQQAPVCGKVTVDPTAKFDRLALKHDGDPVTGFDSPDWLISEPPVTENMLFYGDAKATTWPARNGAYLVMRLENLDLEDCTSGSATFYKLTDTTQEVRPENDKRTPTINTRGCGVWGITYYRGLDLGTSVTVKTVQYAEGVVNPAGPFANLTPAANTVPDQLAIDMVSYEQQRLNHAYYASYNDLGKILGEIFKVAKGVGGTVKTVADAVSGVPILGDIASTISNVLGSIGL